MQAPHPTAETPAPDPTDESTDSHTGEPTDADPLLAEVAR